MLPEVQQYMDAYEKAQENWREYRRTTMNYDKARELFDKDKDEAVKILRNSDDPLIKWIGNNERVLSYHSEACAILRRLPASVTELDTYARREGWCSVYRGFRDEAIAAGVIEVKYDIQYRRAGYAWQDFPPDMLYTQNDNPLKREFITTIFNQGVHSFTLDIDHTTYYFQTKDVAA